MSVRRAAVAVAIAVILVFLPSLGAPARAQVNGPYDIQWVSAAEGNAYPGGNVTVYVAIGASHPAPTANDTIDAVWVSNGVQNFSAPGLPVGLCQGCQYFEAINITIPSAQPANTEIDITYSFNGTYWDGTAFCADENDICGGTYSLTVLANPFVLQDTVNALEVQVSNLDSQVGTLNSQLMGDNATISNYQNEVASFQKNVTALQTEISNDQAQIMKQNENISSLQGEVEGKNQLIASQSQNITSLMTTLGQAESSLASVNSTLANVRSQLTTQTSLTNSQSSTISAYQSEYLPIGILVPSIVAVLLFVMYVRKK